MIEIGGERRSGRFVLAVQHDHIYIYIYIYIYVGRVFTNDPGDIGSIPGHVKPKTLKWYLIPLCLALSNIR